MNIQPAHAATSTNNVVVVAGFPKSGNTLINETLSYAGKLVEPNWIPPRHEWHNDADIKKIAVDPFVYNPYLGKGRCHLKTHHRYSENSYSWHNELAELGCIVLIIRNPFDMLLSSTNYLRYSAATNNSLTANQIATLKHFYPDYTEDDILKSQRFDLDTLRSEGALDKALEIFAASGTCVPQFLKRSGTWVDFYQSFNQAMLPTLQIRFEDVVKCQDKWQGVAATLAGFLDCDANVLANAFACQDQACQQAKNAKDPFFPIADSNYFLRYFEPRSLRRFCNTYKDQLAAMGYEDLVDNIMST